MAKVRSLHIGLNAVDPASYGAPFELQACEADAKDMRRIAKARGSVAKVLLTADATCDAVLEGIASASSKLKSGDLFFLTYSGHGGQVPDVDGDEKDDQLDETWCLYDTQLRDDDISTALAKFAEGVRILMLSDSCHSGTVSRGIALERDEKLNASSAAREKRLPLDATKREFTKHANQYYAREVVPQSDVRATGVLISGCRDNQTSQDGDVNGAFTAAFLEAWGEDGFAGSHTELHEAVTKTLHEQEYTQVPNLQTVAKEDGAYREFLSQRPLHI
jgi:metacaspase-1